jgi:hypothetical protein
MGGYALKKKGNPTIAKGSIKKLAVQTLVMIAIILLFFFNRNSDFSERIYS